jgi:EAL domain-containing protein (putative c-di-GMP-specific phosphodiesterase class I)/HAMP domain-containing protein
MRFGLRARFTAVLLLVVVVAIAALIAIRSEQQAHGRVVSESVQTLSQQQQHGDAQQLAIANIGQADHRYRTALLLTFAAIGLVTAGIALLAWLGLVQPIRRLAHAVRRLEAGDTSAPRLDSRRNDEIGELARAYSAINDAFVAMRSRIDHDVAASRPPPPVAALRPPPPRPPGPAAVPRPPKAGGTMVMPSARDADVEQARLAEMNRAKWAKEAGSPGPTPAAPLTAREQRLEDELREAWQRGEISIVYQPIHALADGNMRGAEALLRWQHPVEGAVPPSVFVPLAERSDLIDTLGRYVLIQACADASLWPCGGTAETTPFLSVNVSARQLLGTQLFEAVVEALQRSGLAAARLHLELPVAALRSDDRGIAAMIEQLRGLGVQIWLDVVGADAADQSRWMKMSVTGVKVGRSRIAGKPDDAADRAATGAIVATAHALRVVAVVVGVEELAQLDLLRAQGAELAQGYVLCKPVDTAEIGRRLLA